VRPMLSQILTWIARRIARRLARLRARQIVRRLVKPRAGRIAKRLVRRLVRPGQLRLLATSRPRSKCRLVGVRRDKPGQRPSPSCVRLRTRSLTNIVTKRSLMTMSDRWNVASAKAELSRVIARAKRAPQVIEKRGEPVAVVVGVHDYERMVERDRRAARWRSFLEISAELRAEGGAQLEIPPRTSRRSPFALRRR
jgi:prevent-host-death family protein